MDRHKGNILLQCDWQHMFSVQDKPLTPNEVWVAYKPKGSTSVYGSLKYSRQSGGKVEGKGGFSVGKVTGNILEVTHDETGTACIFIAPYNAFQGIHDKGIVGLDTTEGGLGVSVCNENKLHVWETKRGTVRRTLCGHMGDVYTCHFFPSGVVILSGGADMQLRIWSAETGECPVVLVGHIGAITDTAIIDRGRNIISVSKDGTARLWDCGESRCLEILHNAHSVVNACSLHASPLLMNKSPSTPVSDREVATEGKMLLLACEAGNLQALDVRNRELLFTFPCPDAANCVAWLTEHHFAVGCQNGDVLLGDIRSSTLFPVLAFTDSASPALSLLRWGEGNRLFVGRSDGTVIGYSSDPAQPKLQLTGSDCDSIYGLSQDSFHVYTACRDATIRKYKIDSLF